MVEQRFTEVAVVGAGPAGLAAAVAAGQAGCRVTLLDAYDRPGGQYYKQLAAGLKSERPGALHHSYQKARQLFNVVATRSNIRWLAGANVWAAEADGERFRLHVEQPGQPAYEVCVQRLVLAPGAYDRALAFPGWDLPGVMTAGGIQTLLKSFRVLPGRRVALSGSGPFLLPVAALLAQSGAEVVGVFEATRPLNWLLEGWLGARHPDKLAEGAGYAATLRRYRVPLRYGRAVIRAEGSGRLERIKVARLDAEWRPRQGQIEELEVDTLGVGYGFMPNTELSYALGCEHRYDPVQGAFFAQAGPDLQSTRPGVYLAGEITGIGGSLIAMRQGQIAGLAVAAGLGRISPAEFEKETAQARRSLRYQQEFAGVLNRLFRLRPGWEAWITPDTTICRCEEVTAGTVRAVVEQSQAHDARTVKSLTRCGMGLCQGRVCGHLVTGMVAHLTGRDPAEVGAFNTRPIVRPLPLARLAEAEQEPD